MDRVEQIEGPLEQPALGGFPAGVQADGDHGGGSQGLKETGFEIAKVHKEQAGGLDHRGFWEISADEKHRCHNDAQSAVIRAEQFRGEIKGNYRQKFTGKGQLLHNHGHEKCQKQGEHDALVCPTQATVKG